MQILKLKDPDLELLSSHTSQIWGCAVQAADPVKQQSFIAWFAELDKLLVDAGIQQILNVMIVDGCSTSNGHALLLEGNPTAWISASNYPTLDTIRVFGTHEIIHALHYAYTPAYYFQTQTEKNLVGRQLVTEGLATYATQELLHLSASEALWSDYLSVAERDEIMARYLAHQTQSIGRILHDWDRSDATYFYSSNRQDVDTYRSGYYIGRLAIENIAHEQSLSILDLLTTARADLDPLIHDWLEKFVR
jgi:uncharacterized protein YjaZ